MKRILVGGTFTGVAAIVATWIAFFGGVTPPGTWTCDLNAADQTQLDSQTAAATAGQTICLTSNSTYDWDGTNKTITVAPAPGVTGAMLRGSYFGTSTDGSGFSDNDCCFTIDGHHILNLRGSATRGEDYVRVSANAHDITIKNGIFRYDGGRVDFVDSSAHNLNITFSGNDFSFNDYIGCPQCTGVQVGACPPADANIVVRGNVFHDGDLTGYKGGCGAQIIDNQFVNICTPPAAGEEGVHTDNISGIGLDNTLIQGNYITKTPINTVGSASACDSGSITAYDGAANTTIRDNVVYGNDRPDAIEINNALNDVIRNNTLETTRSNCGQTDTGTKPCGGIYIGVRSSSADYPGGGTQIYDNIARGISLNGGALIASDSHNMFPGGATGTDFNGVPTFTGAPITSGSTWASFLLASGSDGYTGASDGGPVGIRTH